MTIPLGASGLNFRARPGLGRAARAFYSVKQLKTAFRARLGPKNFFAGFKISAHARPVRFVGGPGPGRASGPGRAGLKMLRYTPVRSEWIVDSGASYHTTPDASLLSSVRPPHLSYPSSIMVGDGSCLPVSFVGSALGPFCLPNVLVAPQMIHNLLSIRQFTTDNSCSVEFDPSGLTVKDSLSAL
jgi:hypothetical protein